MSISRELGRNLVQPMQRWLECPLTNEEHEQLRQFQLGLSNGVSSDPAVHARRQAEQAVESGRQCSEGFIRQVLQNVQQASTQALRAQDSGEQAVLKAVNAAGNLTELRPGHLQSGQASANQLVMSQIANRLTNLMKSETRLRLEQNFGSLRQQLEDAIAIFNQSNHNTSAPPSDKPDPPTARDRTDKHPASRGACIFATHQAWRWRIHNSLAGASIKITRHKPCRLLTGSHVTSFLTAVNDQITDAVTQSNVKIVGETPAMVLGIIYQTTAHSTGILLENAVSAQQQQNVLALAASNMGVMQIYSLDTTVDAGATEKAGQLGVAGNFTSLLAILKSFT